MLVLVSFALVLLALMLLILGVLSSDGLALIYLSILCSVGAGVVLYLATRAGAGKPGTRPALRGLTPPGTPSAAEQTPVLVGAEPTSVLNPSSTDTMNTATIELDREAEAVASPSGVAASLDEGAPFFPIADYDDLTIAEILPLLKELYDDELEVVELHERSTKDRLAIMTAIGDIRSRLASVEGDMTFSEMTAMGADSAGEFVPSLTVPSAWESEVVGSRDQDDRSDEYEPDEWRDEEAWARPSDMEQYEDLPVSEIREQLGRLDEDDLLRLRDLEERGRARRGVIAAIDRELALFEPVPPRRAPARKAAATQVKKAPARKTTATKAPARKTAAATPVKKAPARKTTATKAPARKTAAATPVKKAPARKTTATKAPARKTAAATQVKKAPARKTTATKAPARKTAAATPVKKAPARKTTATKAPARKTAAATPVKKAPARKTTATKAPARTTRRSG